MTLPQVLEVVVEILDELVVGAVFFVPVGEGLIECASDGGDLGEG